MKMIHDSKRKDSRSSKEGNAKKAKLVTPEIGQSKQADNRRLVKKANNKCCNQKNLCKV